MQHFFIYMDHDPLRRQTPSWGLNPHLDMNDDYSTVTDLARLRGRSTS